MRQHILAHSAHLVFCIYFWKFWLVMSYEHLGPLCLQSVHRLIYNLQYIVVYSDQLEMVSVIFHLIVVSTTAFRDNNSVKYI